MIILICQIREITGDIFSEIYSGNKSMYCIEYDSDKSAKPTATRSVSCILADDSISAEADDVEFTPKACNSHGIDAYFPILRGICTLQEAMDKDTAAQNLGDTAEQVFRLVKAMEDIC